MPLSHSLGVICTFTRLVSQILSSSKLGPLHVATPGMCTACCSRVAIEGKYSRQLTVTLLRSCQTAAADQRSTYTAGNAALATALPAPRPVLPSLSTCQPPPRQSPNHPCFPLVVHPSRKNLPVVRGGACWRHEWRCGTCFDTCLWVGEWVPAMLVRGLGALRGARVAAI